MVKKFKFKNNAQNTKKLPVSGGIIALQGKNKLNNKLSGT